MRRNLLNLLQQFVKRLRHRVRTATRVVEDQVHCAGRDRHGVIVVVNQWAPVFNGHLDVLAFEFGAILIAQNREK